MLQISATAGAALISFDATGAERLRIACRRSPAEIHVAVPTLRRVGSEERLTFGAGSAVASLVVPPDVPSGAPVSATGPLTAVLIDALASGEAIGVSYGASNLRRIAPPSQDVARRFAQACRTMMRK